MIKVLFICHGNICRSPMAEFVFRDMAEKRGLGDRFFIRSAATSSEELGNPVHYGTKEILSRHGIRTDGKYAVKMTKKDYEAYDFLIGMEGRNLQNMRRITGRMRIIKWRGFLIILHIRRHADPWYTGILTGLI